MPLKKNLFVLGVFICLTCPLPHSAALQSQGQFTLDVTAMPTRDLLKLIAQHTNKNIIISEQVTGNTTLALHHIPWRKALDAVLQIHNLTKYETAQVISIIPKDTAKNDPAFLQSAVFHLHHISSTQVAKILQQAGVLSPQGKLGTESGTNFLVAVDTKEHLATIKQLLHQLDIPSSQILIEARIVSADELFLQKLGVELYGTALPQPQNKHQIKAQPSRTSAINIQPGKFNLRLTKLNDSIFLDAQLTALENSGRGKVIAHPKLLTANRQEATIESGTEIPYQEKTKEGNTSTMFKKAVLSLKVTPEIVSQDTVNLILHLNQDKVSQITIHGTPAIDTRKIHTQVLVRDNETIVLGGIYEWSNAKHITGIPILRHLPLLGLLFSKKETRLERKELLIFVTPRFVRN